MDKLIYLIPIINAAGVYTCVYLLCRYAFYRGRVQSEIKKELAIVENKIKNKLEAVDFQPEAAQLLDERLDRLILTLQKEIPMASLILSGTLIQKLKAQAHEEILKMLPELKHKLIERLATELDVTHFIEKMDESFWKRYVIRIAYWASFVGLIVGLVLLVIILLIGR